MTRRSLFAAALFAALFAAAGAAAGEAAAGDADGGKKDSVAAKEGAAAGEAEEEPYQFLTGLDFSYWAADAGPNVGGPGLTLGFVLVPRHLEMGLAVGAMVGGHHYTIPVEWSFVVPFHVNEWFAPFVKIGPTLITDKTQSETEYDFAAAFAAGVEFLPVGFDWSVFASGDYNVRMLHEARHQGGFTIGFRYRV
jgi:hypothetical protein